MGTFEQRFAVTALEMGVFQGACHPAWPGRAFGGQLAAQALQAAAASLESSTMHPWSLHTYFHAPVKSGEAITYRVVEVKSGRSVATRQVLIEQDGKLRASAMALFGAPADGPDHHLRQPRIPSPDEVPLVERLLTEAIIPPDADHVAMGYPDEAMFELRIVGSEASSAQHAWMRTVETVGTDPLSVATALCYLSDVTLGTTAIQPHGGREANPDLQFGAIELALWFTAPARLHEWTLFSQDTAFAGAGHALAHGAFYNSDGEVCGIAVQNALMRLRDK